MHAWARASSRAAPPAACAEQHELTELLTLIGFDTDPCVQREPRVLCHAFPELLVSRRHRQGIYTLIDEPDLRVALRVSALLGVSVDLQHLFG